MPIVQETIAPQENTFGLTREGNGSAVPGAPDTGPRHSAVSAGRSTPCAGTLANLLSGVQGALLLRVAPESFYATPGALALLAGADLIFNLASSFFLIGSSGSLNYAALPSFFFHIPLMLLCGFLAAKILSRPGLVTAIPVALIALSIPIELCYGALEWLTAHLPRFRWLEDYLRAPNYFRFFWWWSAAAVAFLIRLRPARSSQRLALLLVYFLLLVTPLWFYPRSDLWISAVPDSESGELHLTEEVLAAQPRLLDEQLSHLLPGQKGEANLYLVGFAGDGTQDVFLKELSAVKHLLNERFGTRGRSVTLANNPQSATSIPFATASNLRQALERAGKVMNRDQDVLFLYLTSHGSHDHELAVRNGSLELDQITPEGIRRMLKSSGIIWKVLVVSACYSGGFIEPLQDDHTLIITAADATHESFGCGYGEKFTWFGEAYFGALKRSYSFTDAFVKARSTIGQWEQQQGETPSNPQLWMGRAMERKLSSLEKQLAARGERVSQRGTTAVERGPASGPGGAGIRNRGTAVPGG